MGQKGSTARKFPKQLIEVKKSNTDQWLSNEFKLKMPNQRETANVKQKDNVLKEESSNETSHIEPEGKDGKDPDVIKAFSQLGKAIESTSSVGFQESPIIKSLRKRNLIHEQNKTKSNIIDPKTLTLLLNDLSDPRYQQLKVLENYKIDKLWLPVLKPFKPADNYVKFDDTTNEDEVGHQGVFEQRQFMDHDKNGSNANIEAESESPEMEKLKKRISVD